MGAAGRKEEEEKIKKKKKGKKTGVQEGIAIKDDPYKKKKVREERGLGRDKRMGPQRVDWTGERCRSWPQEGGKSRPQS